MNIINLQPTTYLKWHKRAKLSVMGVCNPFPPLVECMKWKEKEKKQQLSMNRVLALVEFVCLEIHF